MKEKRILAMFITSAVTLIASLAVTFGVLMTLADPVVATGIVRYEYSFNAANNSLISSDGDTLKLSEDIVFQPASALTWSEEENSLAIWFNDAEYDGEIVYADESISTKLRVIPIRVNNKYNSAIQASISVTYDATTMLGRYTFIKLYDYRTNTFIDYTGPQTVDIAAGAYADYAIIVFADDSSNTGRYTVNWGEDYETINVEVTNLTIVNG